jgi:hydrogenase maturation protein HypF
MEPSGEANSCTCAAPATSGSPRCGRFPSREAPRRSVSHAALGEEALLADTELLEHLGLDPDQAQALLRIVRRGLNSPWTSSVGRLFDVVAALLLGIGEATYEGEAAVWLEAASEPITDPPAEARPQFAIPAGDWRPLLRALTIERKRGIAPALLAARFHQALADWAADAVATQPLREVVLGGGCFQNRLLTERVRQTIEQRTGARVFTPALVPPGDGGLAVGQLAVALLRLRDTQ